MAAFFSTVQLPACSGVISDGVSSLELTLQLAQRQEHHRVLIKGNTGAQVSNMIVLFWKDLEALLGQMVISRDALLTEKIHQRIIISPELELVKTRLPGDPWIMGIAENRQGAPAFLQIDHVRTLIPLSEALYDLLTERIRDMIEVGKVRSCEPAVLQRTRHMTLFMRRALEGTLPEGQADRYFVSPDEARVMDKPCHRLATDQETVAIYSRARLFRPYSNINVSAPGSLCNPIEIVEFTPPTHTLTKVYVRIPSADAICRHFAMKLFIWAIIKDVGPPMHVGYYDVISSEAAHGRVARNWRYLQYLCDVTLRHLKFTMPTPTSKYMKSILYGVGLGSPYHLALCALNKPTCLTQKQFMESIVLDALYCSYVHSFSDE